MPKNTCAEKSRLRSKSVRKPLRDVSNAKTAVKSVNVSKEIAERGGCPAGNDSLDCLLLVHSDLSSLTRQIDELVVQALQLKSNNVGKEIKQFADLLSDMQTSLKPWVPRLEKALFNQSMRPDGKSEQPRDGTVVCAPKESTDDVIESPEQAKWESVISPSPLVSWRRAECNTQGGRQLFLLTPLHQTKTFSAKCQTSAAIPAFKKMTSEASALQPVFPYNPIENLGDHLIDSASANPPGTRVLDKAVDNLEIMCAPPPKHPKSQCSVFVMTPCLKMSPPKSCILLEPVSALSRKKNLGVHRSTPFPNGVQNASSGKYLESQSTSIRTSDDLKVKYPELYGIKMNIVGNRTMEEDSPNWIVSPPKTCVVMEPSDEKSSNNLSSDCLPAKSPAIQSNLQDINGTHDLAESTPMLMGSMSSFRQGKHPGENTLKRELWTKFEAASTHSTIRFTTSVLQNTRKKGFLDRLEEASDL